MLKRTQAVFVGFVIMVTASCAVSESTGSAQAPSQPPAVAIGDGEGGRSVAEVQTREMASEFESLPVEGILYAAPTVVTATVTGVEGPFWNQSDGQKWSDDPVRGDYTIPVLYREVKLEIDSVTRDDFGITADKASIKIVALGGGPSSDDPDSYAAGHFSVGDRLVLFLSMEPFYMRDKPIVVIQPFYLAEGVFHVRSEDGVEIAVPDLFIDVYDDIGGEYSGEEFADIVASMPRITPKELLADAAESRKTSNSKWEPYRPESGDAVAFIEEVMSYLENGDEG